VNDGPACTCWDANSTATGHADSCPRKPYLDQLELEEKHQALLAKLRPEVINTLVQFFNGNLTEHEVVSTLADLGPGVLGLIPETGESYPSRPGLKEKVTDLLQAIERGEAIRLG
jgi:hypothetical protein